MLTDVPPVFVVSQSPVLMTGFDGGVDAVRHAVHTPGVNTNGATQGGGATNKFCRGAKKRVLAGSQSLTSYR